MIIDAHQHFWSLSRGDYAWLTSDLPKLYRDFTPADLAPELAGAGISATVLVQAAPTDAETRFLLGLAEAWPTAAAVVGWADLTDPAVEAVIAQLAAHWRLKSLRPMIQDEPDPAWMLQASVGRGLEAMVRAGLRLDALVRPNQLSTLNQMIARHPDLPVVLDHAGKPDIAGGGFEPWAADILALSHQPQVCCKLSGLLTEAGDHGSDADLRPYLDHLLAAFGPERIMWGSDWPVLTLAGSYGGWFDQCMRLTQGLSRDEQAWIFGKTAAAFYGLEELA